MARLAFGAYRELNRFGRPTIKKSNPDTARGAIMRFRKSAAMFLCPTCSRMLPVVKVDNHIVQGPNSTTYSVSLACGCPPRSVTLAVTRYGKQKEEFEKVASPGPNINGGE